MTCLSASTSQGINESLFFHCGAIDLGGHMIANDYNSLQTMGQGDKNSGSILMVSIIQNRFFQSTYTFEWVAKVASLDDAIVIFISK